MIAVRMGEMAVSSSAGDELTALGLGSCIGLALVDRDSGVAGLVHVVLPDSRGDSQTPGKVADLAVCALDEIELQREERTYDVPHGTWRFTRPPAGFRATVVAGTPTWLDCTATGARPGRVLRPGS